MSVACWWRDQGQSQVRSNSVGPQQSKVDVQPQGSSQSSQVKPPGLLQGVVPVRYHPGNVKAAGQNVHGGEVTSQAVSSASPILEQVKDEMNKAAGPAQAVRPLQIPASCAFSGFQARPQTLSMSQTVGMHHIYFGPSLQVRG